MVNKRYEFAVSPSERDNPNPSFGLLWGGFAESTTAHGIPRVTSYTSKKYLFMRKKKLFIILTTKLALIKNMAMIPPCKHTKSI